jgi:photosystem II stability/assembly factor-like uncharacterized protein
VTAQAPEVFWEDMGRKARWFLETRGARSRAELNAKWRAALEQIDVLRESRLEPLDPGGSAVKGTFALVGAPRGTKASQVEEPSALGTKFVTEFIEVRGIKSGRETWVKLAPRRGVGTKFDLDTAMVFVYDRKFRKWNLVDRSGFNRRGRYLWALTHRDGIYAGVALPADTDAVRRLVLERFARHQISYGIDAGFYGSADDYFRNRGVFRRAAAAQHDLGESRADREQLRNLAAVYQESLELRADWERRLPNGGRPEWQILDHISATRSSELERLNLGDLHDLVPWLFRLENRVGRWYPNGPLNVNGRVKSLAIDPTDSSVLYAGAANGGVWKTDDGGDTWRHLWTFEDSMAVGAIALGRRAVTRGLRGPGPATIYAATGEEAGGWTPSYGGVGVYKSIDDGHTWEKKGDQYVLGDRCARVQLHPRNPATIYLASDTGVHKSTDGGDNWDVKLPGYVTDLVIAHDHPDTLYAGIWNDGIYKTTNGGDHWDPITGQVRIFLLIAIIEEPFPRGGDAGWIKLAIGRDGEFGSDLIYAKLGKDGGRTLASTDGGASWAGVWGSEAVDYDEWTSFVAIHPNDPYRLYLGGLNLQYSHHGWDFQQSTGSHSDHHAMVFDPHDPATCYTCCDGGVYKSTNYGAHWTLASSYMQATQLMSLGVAQSGTFVAGSATQDQGIIQTEGSSWWDDFGGGNEWGMFVVDPNNSNNIYVSPGSGQLRVSTDRGRSYTNPTGGLTDPWPSQGRQTVPAQFAHVAVRPGISNFLIGAAHAYDEVKDANGNVTDSYGPYPRLYYSRDTGLNWWNAHSLPADGNRVAYAPSDDRRAYAGTNNGRFYRNDHGGEAGWYEPASGANKPPAGNIMAVTVDPTDADTVYIAYSDHNPHLYRTTDGGHHWTAINGTRADMQLPDIAASALVVDHENSDVLYVGTDAGVFRSNDWGSTWYWYNDAFGDNDLPKVVVSGLGAHSATNRLFASTMGRGLYYTYTSGIPRLRVTGISHYFHGRRHQGIQYLRLTDGAHTYVMSRADVIRRIEAGTYVYTTGSDGSHAEVIVMPPDSEHPIDYLTTPADATEADNLLSMPEF